MKTLNRPAIRAGEQVRVSRGRLPVFVRLTGLCIGVSLLWLSNVPTSPNASDIDAFTAMGITPEVRPFSFKDEIRIIREAQRKVFAIAPVNEGIPIYSNREPEDLLRARHGLCYDRSRSLDKALQYLGFRTRHVYILYSDGKRLIPAFFKKNQPSHAMTEVRTSKGWLLVDSNAPWISLTRSGDPVPADQVWQQHTSFEGTPAYLQQHWWTFRGLYSRKGSLYHPHIWFPDINWYDFLTSASD